MNRIRISVDKLKQLNNDVNRCYSEAEHAKLLSILGLVIAMLSLVLHMT
jgi:hypothetical protein